MIKSEPQRPARAKPERARFGPPFDSFERLVRSFIDHAVGTDRKGKVVQLYFSAITRRPPTFAEFGTDYGVSRQYIHQLIVRGKKLMSRPDSLVLLADFWAGAKEVLKRHAGLVSLARLSEELAGRFDWRQKPNVWILARVLPLNPDFRVDRSYGYAYLADFACAECARGVQELQALLKHRAEELPFDRAGRELAERCRRICSRPIAKPEAFGIPFVERAVARSGRRLVTDGKSVYTREYAGVRNHSNLSDALYLILSELGRPMHYQKLTRMVRERYPGFGKISGQLVARRLRGQRFMRVRLAVYGLAGWKYPNYQARLEAIADVMRQHPGPVTQTTVVSALVRSGRFEKKEVLNALEDQHWFIRTGPGRYSLRLRAGKPRKPRGPA